jgi:phage gpG-like protein
VRVKFSGDFAKLRRFEKKVALVPKTLVRVNEQLAEETIELIREGFERSEDPYKRPWPRLKLRRGRPLEDTGAMKSAWHRGQISARGFTVSNAKRYAAWHQGGTGIYGVRRQLIRPVRAKALRLPGPLFFRSVRGTPKRLMVPVAGRLPPAWRARYEETATDVLTELFR